ncbi:MAG: acyltransferase family protein [Nitrospiraceae bacterium]|nr:acyltransferase family protein [Nitrospiraceae bacterium]
MGHGNLELAKEDPHPERRMDIDWLRGLIVLAVVAYHGTLPFVGVGTYKISAGEECRPMAFFAWFCNRWQMPALFVLAGVAACYALRVRSTRQYVKERFTRLLIPFVFGTLVVVPPQAYCRNLYEGFKGSYLAFYPHFFNGPWPQGNLTWAHLWFILYLFVISLLALPLLLQFNKAWGQRLIAKLAAACAWPGVIFLFAVPFGITEVLLRAKYPWTWALVGDWAMLSWYLCLYVIGFLIASDERFWRAIERHGVAALIGGILTTALGIGLMLKEWWVEPGWSLPWILLMFLSAFRTWFWVVAILAAGSKFLRIENRLLPHVREGSYPFYIVHQTVLVIIAWKVVHWDAPLMVRYLLIVVGAVIVTWAIYDLAIRRWSPMRFLFGMRPRVTK